jgi:hypothetical protein
MSVKEIQYTYSLSDNEIMKVFTEIFYGYFSDCQLVQWNKLTYFLFSTILSSH